MTEAMTPFQLGYLAYYNKKPLTANPYKLSAPGWDDWRQGWFEARTHDLTDNQA